MIPRTDRNPAWKRFAAASGIALWVGAAIAFAQPPAGDVPTSPGLRQDPPPPQGPPPPAGPEGQDQPPQGQIPGQPRGQGPAGQRRGGAGGRGGFIPGGPNRGFGPGPGAPGFPPPIGDSDDFRQRWARLDGGRLIELTSTLEMLSRTFNQLESDRDQALAELDKARTGFDPNQMDPATVVRRQQVERLLGRLHETVEKQRIIQADAGWLLNLIEDNKAFVSEMLARTDSGARAGERITGPRASRWSNAMAALDNNQRPRWARLLLGDALGPLALRWAGQEAPGDGGPPPGGPNGGPNGIDPSQQRLVKRQEQLDDLVKRVMELNATVERQGQEIQELKRMMTNGTPGTAIGQGSVAPKP